MIEKLASKEVQKFIRENENIDPFELSLQNNLLFDLPVELIANQIMSRKKARTKLPGWYSTEGIIFPPPFSMEQCSSEVTAKNKSAIISGDILIDLTGGAGVDTYYLSKVFKNVIYVEQSNELCEIARHNFNILGASNINIINHKSEEFINTYKEKVSVIYIDPARRDQNKSRVFKWSDCQPDLPNLQHSLFSVSTVILSKASPMLDIKASLNELKNVAEVHVVSVKNECKEVLYLQNLSVSTDSPKVITKDFHSNEDSTFDFSLNEEQNASAIFSEPKLYLYEPNASILKAGAFNLLCERFKISKLHPQTHLYTSEKLIQNFPGRKFTIKATTPLNKKELLKWAPDKKANISARNFPQDVATIRKKTGIKPGGDIYYFATTLADNKKTVIICEKTQTSS